MGNTKIEYLDKTWNFYTGCRNWQNGVCPVGEKCWAKAIDKRFSRSFEPQFHADKILEPLSVMKPSRIGVCFTGDLFGDWVDPEQEVERNLPYTYAKQKMALSEWVIYVMQYFKYHRQFAQHQFYFLTKSPNNYKNWGVFPDNSYLGSSVCNIKMMARTFNGFANAQAKNFWISFEPLMERIPMNQFPLKGKDFNVSWVVIGGWSQGKRQPNIEWIKEIVDACDKSNIRVFIKNNLKPILPEITCRHLRQEFPL